MIKVTFRAYDQQHTLEFEENTQEEIILNKLKEICNTFVIITIVKN